MSQPEAPTATVHIDHATEVTRLRSASRRVQLLLATAVATQPLLIAVNGIFHPDVDMEAASLLAGAARGAGTWYAVHLIAALGAVLGAPAALGLRRLLSEDSRIGNVALGTGLAAAFVLSLSFAAEASVLRLAVTADIGGSAALALAEGYLRSPEFFAVGLGVLLAGLTAVLFGVALLREHRVPRWMPLATIAGTVLSMGTQPGSALAPIAFAVVAVAAIGLARYVAAEPH